MIHSVKVTPVSENETEEETEVKEERETRQ